MDGGLIVKGDDEVLFLVVVQIRKKMMFNSGVVGVENYLNKFKQICFEMCLYIFGFLIIYFLFLLFFVSFFLFYFRIIKF